MGLLLGVARGSAEPPRLIVFATRSARRAGRAGARAGRQGHHVRHRRHLDQAGRGHGPDEGRHGRRRGRRRRDARDRAARARRSASSASSRRPRTCRAAARSKPGDVLRGAQRQDGRGDQHRRRGTADPRRRALVRAQQLGATHLVDVATLTGACVVALGHDRRGLFGTPPWWVDVVREPRDARGRSAAGRCRSTRNTASSSRATSPT